MKVLFAVNNENISESIIKRYQQDYKEIISVRNVYYFNAIIKELQRDKSYDRIVISEDLEPFSNNNYDAIDKFIFDKMDNISDEATNSSGNDIPIILICSDRRAKSEPLLVRLFGIGVYNALIGKDRSITNVCELLNRPRGKKEAKAYYRIDSEDVDYKVENEGDVSEIEIQNILNHYKKLGRNEEKYVESFEHIASQYTDAQLRLIAKFLPLNVKAVLEANSQKYQEIISFGNVINQEKQPSYNNYQNNLKNEKSSKQQKNNQNNGMNLEIIEKNLSQNKIKEPVIIPSAINTAKVRKLEQTPEIENVLGEMSMPKKEENMLEPEMIEKQEKPEVTNEPVVPIIEGFEDMDSLVESVPEIKSEPVIEEPEEKMVKAEEVQPVQPRKRGRPRKVQTENTEANPNVEVKKRGRGRPRKVQVEENNVVNQTNTMQPAQNIAQQATPINLFELGEEDTQISSQENKNTTYSDMILPGLDDEEMYMEQETMGPIIPRVESKEVPEIAQKPQQQEMMTSQTPETVHEEKVEETQTFVKQAPDVEQISINEPQVKQQQPVNEQQVIMPNRTQSIGITPIKTVQNTGKYDLTNVDLSGLLTGNKKVVAFVGTSKNGTSFLVNNLAQLLSQKGIKTAVLDLTQNRNAYYIYTENEEPIRAIAYEAISNLRRGNPQGIQVNKNLTVYTTLPGENDDINDYSNILETLIKNYSLILLDCDFETNYGYFKEAQEIYLVQSLDILTIQPLTAFLRDLKAKNVLNPEKVRIVLNKLVKVRTITDKTIIGGMAYYNDPAMSFMTELFNKDTVPYCTIPFEEQVYSKYLEGLVNCKISLNGYSKNLMAALANLSNMVYPLIVNGGSTPAPKNYNNYANNNSSNFSNSMNDTLSKMKKNY